MTSLRSDLSLTSVQPSKSRASPFYGSLKGLGFKIMHSGKGRYGSPKVNVVENSQSIPKI